MLQDLAAVGAWLQPIFGGGYFAPIRSHWALRLRPHPPGDKD